MVQSAEGGLNGYHGRRAARRAASVSVTVIVSAAVPCPRTEAFAQVTAAVWKRASSLPVLVSFRIQSRRSKRARFWCW